MPDPARVMFYDTVAAGSHLTTSFAQWAYNTVPDWHEHIAERMAEIFPSLKEATIEVTDAPDNQHGRTGYVRFRGQTPLGIDQFGDGARHAFKLIAHLVALAATVDESHPGMMLWEEPEVFQNPATLGRLLDVVVDLLKDKPIQVFITTQSLEVIAHLTRMLQRDILPPEQTLAFRLNLRDGVLKSAWGDIDTLTAWLEAGLDPRILENVDLPLQFHLREEVHED
jgi:predicted ATPase